MPTGYTAAIAKGISFKTFILDCARAFGACVTLRDEPGGGEAIPDEFEPSTTYKDAAIKAQKEIDAIEAMTEDEIDAAIEIEYTVALCKYERQLRETADLKNKYLVMINAVHKWEPPTDDHVELKTFMLDQIDKSVKLDCNISYLTKPIKLSPSAWKLSKVQKALENVIYYTKEHKKEIERTANRNEWIKALRESIKEE